MKNPMIINIQKYSVHDGEGIRTTVFFKGCPLCCHWCHNPESQSYEKELLFDRDRCSGCGFCAAGCKEGAIVINEGIAVTDATSCDFCGRCLDYCPQENREIAGKVYDTGELVEILLKDRAFYEQSGGGVSLSGGEVMCQDMDYVESLLQRLKEEGIRVNVDTCGFAPVEHFSRALPYVDEFLYDIKMLDGEKHKKYTGQTNELILSNFSYLLKNQAKVRVRIPVIPGVNDEAEEMETLAMYLKNAGAGKINLLPYHSTGSSKYEKLGREYPAAGIIEPDEQKMEEIAAIFTKYGCFDVKIGG